MGQITDYVPSKEEVKEIWKDSYNLIIRFQDVDIFTHEDELNKAFHEFEEKYHGCRVVAHLTEGAVRALIGYRTVRKG